MLALGGGTPCYGNNLKILNDDKKVVTIYLKLSIPLLATRLYAERDNRPLISHLSSEEELLEFIGKHIFERTQYYNQAQHIITTDHQTKKDILEAILLELI